jgi:DNA invertase Pin-like site-specific DNA recombinase
LDQNGHGRAGLTRLMADILDARVDVVITQDIDRTTE